MRTLTLTLNAASAVVFVVFFTYTFIARTHLEAVARNFVNEKTLEYSGPIIEAVETALEAPFVSKLVSGEERKLVHSEITAYRIAPATYIADLTGKDSRNPQEERGSIARKATDAKGAIRRFCHDTLSALISDLRIFSGTNVLAVCVALFLMLKSSRSIRKPLVVFSLLLFVAVVFCSFLYVDDLSFFRILTATHMGWWYPVAVIVTAVLLYRDVGDMMATAT